MQKQIRYILDPAFSYIKPKQNLCQNLGIFWFDLTDKPPIDRLLYVCYNNRESLKDGEFMKCTIIENVKYMIDSNGCGHYMHCVDESNDFWKPINQPDYWAFKEFPKPPIEWS